MLRANASHNIWHKCKIVNEYVSPIAANLGVIGIRGDQGLGYQGNLLYKPEGFGDNPAGSTYGKYAGTIYLYPGSAATSDGRGITKDPMITVISGSGDYLHERSYFGAYDVNGSGNDDEISYLERSGSGGYQGGECILFVPKFGDSADSDDQDSYDWIDRRDTSGLGYFSGSAFARVGAYTKFQIPISSSKSAKLSFYAKDDSSFNGYFGQAWVFEPGIQTGITSQSVLTTSWKQYETTSPTVSENTVAECWFVCSGSAGSVALDQISASYV